MPLRRRRILTGAVALAVVLAAMLAAMLASARGRFLAGGAMVNAGYELQDGVHLYDFSARAELTPDDVWREFLEQNKLASGVRRRFPRSEPHPVIAIVACMDSRVDTVDLVGDTRKYYYVLRLAGSVMGAQEEDMLELAVANGVKVVVLTTHSDCAAERIAKDPASQKLYPSLVAAVDEREQRVSEFLARPLIAEKIRRGELLVRRVHLDTETEELVLAH